MKTTVLKWWVLVFLSLILSSLPWRKMLNCFLMSKSVLYFRVCCVWKCKCTLNVTRPWFLSRHPSRSSWNWKIWMSASLVFQSVNVLLMFISLCFYKWAFNVTSLSLVVFFPVLHLHSFIPSFIIRTVFLGLFLKLKQLLVQLSVVQHYRYYLS